MLKTLNFTLSNEQENLAIEIGHNRYASKNEYLRDNDPKLIATKSECKYSTSISENMHIMGVKAEIAYSILTKKNVDTQYFRDHGDQYDFDGVEVKSSSWKYDDIELKIPIEEYYLKTPKIYVLARVDGNLIQFCGYITREMFDLRKYPKKHLVNNYCIEACNLINALPYYENNILKFIQF